MQGLLYAGVKHRLLMITVTRGAEEGILGRGCHPQFTDKEDLFQTKFADKEGFPRIPMSTSTKSVQDVR